MAPSEELLAQRLRMTSLRVGIIGCGRMGAFHARTLSEDPESEIAYLFDVDASRSSALGRRFGVEYAARPHGDVDALIIASPSATHVDYLDRAVSREIPVLVEKPLCPSVDESARFSRSSRVWVGHCERFNPAFKQVKVPDTGELTIRRMAPVAPSTHHGDVIMDLMIHDLDLLRYFGGEVESLRLVACEDGPQGLSRVAVVVETASGLRAKVIASQCHGGTERIWEFAAHGLRFDLHRGEAYADRLPLPRHGGQDALRDQWGAFKAALHGERSPIADAFEAHRAVVLADRIQQLALGTEYARAS